jgi:hypothetical protein
MTTTADSNSTQTPTTPTATPQSIFHAALYPPDSYTSTGTYWADLPYLQRLTFITAVDLSETLSELHQIATRTPWSSVRRYFRNYVLPGAGLGLEG